MNHDRDIWNFIHGDYDEDGNIEPMYFPPLTKEEKLRKKEIARQKRLDYLEEEKELNADCKKYFYPKHGKLMDRLYGKRRWGIEKARDIETVVDGDWLAIMDDLFGKYNWTLSHLEYELEKFNEDHQY